MKFKLFPVLVIVLLAIAMLATPALAQGPVSVQEPGSAPDQTGKPADESAAAPAAAPPPATDTVFLNEGFDGATFPPAGWAQVIVNDPGTDPIWTRETAGTLPTINPHSGAAMTKFNSYNATSGASARLYGPALDLTGAAAPVLSFWMGHYNSTTNDRIQVQVSTDGGTTWNNVGAEIPRHDATCTTACWKSHSQDLSAYAGQPSVMVGLLGISAYGYNIFIDDVLVFSGPDFATSYKTAPAQVLVNDPIQYVVHIANTGTEAATGATMTDAIPAGVTYVASSVTCSTGTCGYDGGANAVTWTGSVAVGATAVVTFTVDTDGAPCGTVVNTAVLSHPNLPYGPVSRSATTMVAYTLPILNEGFEGTTFPPAGWTEVIVNDPGTDPDWTRETAGTLPTINPHSGAAMTKFNSYNATSLASARLYSPALDLTGATAPVLSFWMGHYNSTTNDRIQVQVSTDGGTTWNNVGAEIPRHDATCTTACWKSHSQDLSAYAGQPSVMVGLLGISAYGYNIFIDDVKIGEPWAPCPYVSLEPNYYGGSCRGGTLDYPLTATNITPSSETYNLSASFVWPTTVDPASLTLASVAAGSVTASVYVPWATAAGTFDTATVVAAGQTNGLSDSATIKTTAALLQNYADYADIPSTAGYQTRDHSLVYYDGKLYKFGGYGGSGAAQNFTLVYDIAANTWTTADVMPAIRYWIDCVEIGGKIYCGGGYQAAAVTTMYIFDPAAPAGSQWTTDTANPLPAARYAYAGVALGGKYYLIGGYTTAYVNTIAVYDPAAPSGSRWDTTRAPMNVARRYPAAGVIGGQIYVAGGMTGSSTYTLSTEVYDPATNTWTLKASIPAASPFGTIVGWVRSADAVLHDRYLVWAGGSYTDAGATNAVLVYDAVTDNWSFQPYYMPHVFYGAEGDADANGNFWFVSGRIYENATWGYSKYTTRAFECAACTPVSGASLTVDPAAPRPGIPATFSGAVAGGSAPLTWSWDFGDGATATGQTVVHTYAEPNTYHVILTVANCDGQSVATAEQDIIVMAGPLANISPLQIEATQCPDSRTQQDLLICNDGDQPLTWTMTETIPFPQRAGIESLSGSFVAFDPAAGGDLCYQAGEEQTFCFRAESFTNDWEYRYSTWLKFPADWNVSNAYLVGTPVCDSGNGWSTFVWGYETSPYEIQILHSAYQAYSDHCVATYCVDVTPGASGGSASWYYDGDGYNNAPHHPCSSDVYTPASMAGEPCDEALNPQAIVPECADTSPVPWLDEDLLDGTVAAGACQTVTIGFDSFGLGAGDYGARLEIDTNDVLNPAVDIPVTLTVAGPPTNPAFTSTPAAPIIGQEIAFHGSADALLPVEYSWDFGDGTTGTGQDPTHAYAAYGTYTVTMTAAECGEAVVAEGTVTVLPCFQLVEENFEGAFPPAGWTVVNNGGSCVWSRNDAFATPRPNYAGGQGFCADADSDKCGSSTTMDTELRTMVLDLSDVHTATLEYVTSYNDIATGGDIADVDVSIDGGATWANVLRWDEDHDANGPGVVVSLDLTPYVGFSDVLVRFHYYVATYDWWWEVDQVSLFGCFTPGAVPDIAVAPATLSAEQCPDTTTGQTLQVCNNGTAPLAWILTEMPVSRVQGQTIAATPGMSAQTVPGPANPTVDPAIAPLAPASPDDVLLDQPPNAVNGLFSDAACSLCSTGMQSIADNFILDGMTQLEQIVFWSGYFSADQAIDPDILRVLIHQDAAGVPGAVVYDESNVAYTRAQTGVILFGVHEWMHTLTLATPVTLPPGVYWVEIYNNTGAAGVDFFWETGTQDATHGIYDSVFALETPGVTWYANGGYDLAFQLIGTPLVADIPWLSEAPTRGTVLPGACAAVNVTFDSTGLAPGNHLGSLLVDSNDPDTPQIAIPVDLTVLEPVAITNVAYTVANLQVTFDATATGAPPLTYAWSFGDGATSDLEDPVHTYAAGGCYDVSLTVGNGCGTDTWTGQVCVCDPVTGAGFTFTPPDPEVGEVVSFFGTVAGGTEPFTWSWDFGDSSTGTGQNVTHAYTAPGDYVVILTVSNDCGQSVVQHTVTVIQVAGTLQGHVYNSTTGAPINGALVTANPGGYNDTSDATGFYSIGLPEGTYVGTATAGGYIPQSVTGLVVVANQTTTQDYHLTPQGAWTQAGWPAPCPDFTRFDAEYFSGNGLVYILGGRGGSDGAQTYGNIYSFDPAAGTCADTGAVMPVPISNYTIVPLNDGTADLLCTFGGRDAAGVMVQDVQCYDPLANTASVVTQLPVDFSTFLPGGAAVVNNQAYVFGGFRNTASPYHITVTYRYDPVADTFTQLGNLAMGRGYMNVAVVDGKIYAFGGNVWDGVNLNAQVKTEVMADPGGAGTWDDTAVAELPTATGEGRAFGFNSDSTYGLVNQIVVAGGGQWPNDTIEAFLYDIASNSYDYSFVDLITTRRNHAGVFIPTCTNDPADGLPGMWVIGGRSSAMGGDLPPYAPPEFYPLPCVEPLVPDIDVSISSLSEELCPDATDTISFDICNTGTAELSWSLAESPDTPWLSESPAAGTVPAGECRTVDVTFDTAGMTAGDYGAALLLDSNDPDEPQLTLPVALTVLEPVSGVDFGFTPANPRVGVVISFAGTVELGAEPLAWAWDFNDGTTGTGQNVTHAYTAAGSYDVTLTVSNICGDATALHTVTVAPSGVYIYLPVVFKHHTPAR